MARGYERTLCEALGQDYAITGQPAIRRSLILRELCKDLQLGALVDTFHPSTGGSAKSVWVGIRIPSVENLHESYAAYMQGQWGWKKPCVPCGLTVWNRLSPVDSKELTIPLEQVVHEIAGLGSRATPDVCAFRERLLNGLANATIPDWIGEPVGAALVAKALAVRHLEGRCSEAIANALIKRTPHAPAYREGIHRFRQWLESA